MDWRIGFFGDSFVNGFGDPEGLGWVGRVCAAAIARGHTVTNYNGGIRGDTSADVRVRWHKEALRRLPAEQRRSLLFSFGVNDRLSLDNGCRIEPAASLAHARQILAQAKAFAPTLMIGPPAIAEAAVNARVQGLSAAFAALCRELAVPFLDVFGPLATCDAWMREIAAGDGAHPASGGYQAVADLVEHWAPWRAWLP